MGQSNSEMNIYWKMIMIYNKNFFFQTLYLLMLSTTTGQRLTASRPVTYFELKKSIEIRPWISLDTAAILYAVTPVFFWLTLPHKIKNFLRKWPAKYCKYNTLNLFFTYLALCRPFLEKYIKQRANNMKTIENIYTAKAERELFEITLEYWRGFPTNSQQTPTEKDGTY